MDPIVLHLVDVRMQQGRMFQELADWFHTATQECLSLRQTLPSPTKPASFSTY